jgi:hypothetical protein
LSFYGTALSFTSTTLPFTSTVLSFTDTTLLFVGITLPSLGTAFLFTNTIVKLFYLQIEMQAIAKTVRIEQTQCVKIITLYITCTVDDTLRQMHNEKVNVVNSVTSDLNIDDMYNDMMHVNKFMKTYNTTKVYK